MWGSSCSSTAGFDQNASVLSGFSSKQLLDIHVETSARQAESMDIAPPTER